MTLVELVQKCASAISDDTGLVLTLPRRAGGSDRVRLFGRHGGPAGELLQETHDGRVVARFDPIDVLEFLAKKQLVKVKVKSKGQFEVVIEPPAAS